MKIIAQYRQSFTGLSREVWYLALITLINRAGTMVIPFLSLYLKHDKHFSLDEVGWIMSAFGLGSVAGAWIGGKLTTRIGYQRVMYWSLILSGGLFVGMAYLETIFQIAFGAFVLMMVSDAFRPAALVAISAYAGAENRMRSISLYRLAINLGFAFGPAIGGWLIAFIGYVSLFWVDGLTCVIAGALLMFLLGSQSPEPVDDKQAPQNPIKPHHDRAYLLLILVVFLTGFTFLQYFSTVPLFYKDVAKLSEIGIGWLMTLNGALIFLVEMPLVKKLDQPHRSAHAIIIFSFVLMILSFVMLILPPYPIFLTIGMLCVTIGEILNFPFLNNLAIKHAEQKGALGEYMAVYAMAFAVAHIVAHTSGMALISLFGYQLTWLVMAGILVLALLLLLRIKKQQNAN